MKKTLTLFAGVVIVAILFTSCLKSYTCTCTASGSSLPIVYSKTKKPVAQLACSSTQATLRIADSTTVCTLK